MQIHLFNVTTEEAEASLEEHGQPVCTHKGCEDEAVLACLLKPPSAGWGQQISCCAACEQHLDNLLGIIEDAGSPGGH